MIGLNQTLLQLTKVVLFMPIVLQSLPRFVRLVGHVKDIPLDGAICLLLLLFSSEKVQPKKLESKSF